MTLTKTLYQFHPKTVTQPYNPYKLTYIAKFHALGCLLFTFAYNTCAKNLNGSNRLFKFNRKDICPHTESRSVIEISIQLKSAWSSNSVDLLSPFNYNFKKIIAIVHQQFNISNRLITF